MALCLVTAKPFDAQWGKSRLNGALFTRLMYAGV
jgi:hypothetical protein